MSGSQNMTISTFDFVARAINSSTWFCPLLFSPKTAILIRSFAPKAFWGITVGISTAECKAVGATAAKITPFEAVFIKSLLDFSVDSFIYFNI